MKITLLTVGKTDKDWVKQGTNEIMFAFEILPVSQIAALRKMGWSAGCSCTDAIFIPAL